MQTGFRTRNIQMWTNKFCFMKYDDIHNRNFDKKSKAQFEIRKKER